VKEQKEITRRSKLTAWTGNCRSKGVPALVRLAEMRSTKLQDAPAANKTEHPAASCPRPLFSTLLLEPSAITKSLLCNKHIGCAISTLITSCKRPSLCQTASIPPVAPVKSKLKQTTARPLFQLRHDKLQDKPSLPREHSRA
jgi:hypothetical protein